jgi:hypothetical protein
MSQKEMKVEKMATEITVNFIWVDSNNEWQIPEDWDPHQFDELVSVNLNEVAENWNDSHPSHSRGERTFA